MNKNIFLISTFLLATLSLSAQNEQDALRYSFLQTGGTARSMSMGGAFGALGGDFSSLSINPAGLGIFRKGTFSFSPEFQSSYATAHFLGSKNTDSRYRIAFGQFGVVIPLSFNNEGGLKGLNFAIGYNKLRDFNQNVTMQGVNHTSSLVDEFVYSANTKSSLDPFSEGLAWETWLIDTLSGGTEYYSDFTGSDYGQIQRRTISKKGQVGEYVIGLSANLNQKFFMGASLGIQKASYTEVWEHTELDPDDVINFFQGFSFRNQLETTGTGLNLKVGFLAKPFEFIRIAGALHTPTFYNFNDTFTASMSTDLADGQDTHTWDNYGEFNYEITTPFRAVGSVAVVLKKIGLVSLDYEYVDYSQARLRGTDYDFFDENQAVSTRYRPASNIRIGAEYRMMNLFFRGGYAFYQSPYVSGEPNHPYNLSVISAGMGYRDSNFFFDAGISRGASEMKYFLYADNSADLKNIQSRFTMTLGIRF
ncbi:MAG: hypothetical protein J7L89_00540 [Bacteroidales bacterium]|nr:hypothetical protein [Bacteroidales bacterium]